MRFANRYSDRGALTITLCWVIALAVSGSSDVLLFLAPALLIAVPLLAGRYVGEGLIAKLAAVRARRPRPLPSIAPRPCKPAIRLPRGTALLAFSLAERPPPLRPLPQI